MGRSTGPTNPTNPGGTGDKVVDADNVVDFTFPDQSSARFCPPPPPIPHDVDANLARPAILPWVIRERTPRTSSLSARARRPRERPLHRQVSPAAACTVQISGPTKFGTGDDGPIIPSRAASRGQHILLHVNRRST